MRKLVINDWVQKSSELTLKDRGRMVKWHVPIRGNFCWEVGSNTEKGRATIASKEFLYK